MDQALEQVSKMRTLAAELRAHAAETSVEIFRRKFEAVASDLEEAALEVETSASFRLAG
ncbi:MAG TPA: hypothetical protein VJS47_11065 [Rhizomicrobium sp.]|nr:hypothetical protein [Rhizomicrobium sp.]